MNHDTRPDGRLRRIQTIGYLLDDAIRVPVIGYRIGWDAVIGMIPGLGDVAGFVLSAYLVLEASRYGLPAATLLRMIFNIILEAVIGAVPALGDLFDAVWKANRRNVALLEKHLEATDARPKAADRRFVFAVLLVFVGVLAGLGFVMYLAVEWAGSLIAS